MPKILVDGDGCPVVEETIHIAHKFNMPVILVADTAHELYFTGIKTIVVDKGKDRTDFVLLQNVEKNDIVITQDYGLAALVLSRNAYPITQNGLQYTNENIDGLLSMRHIGGVLRKHKRYSNMKKRSKEDDEKFMSTLEKVLEECIKE